MKTNDNAPEKRVFKNNFLESLTRTNRPLTISWYASMILLLLVIGCLFTKHLFFDFACFYFSGLLFWSLFEYFMHRYVFHINEHINGTERFAFIIHGIHHKNPKDEERIFMPPVPGTIILLVLTGIFFLLMKNNSFFFTAGLLNGYLLYASIHFMIHTKPPKPRFRKLWQHHALHHYRYPDKAFGVSSPLWDYVFGTMPPKEK